MATVRLSRTSEERKLKIGAPAEKAPGEARVALTPDSAKQLIKLGHECLVQKGAGKRAGFNLSLIHISEPTRPY